MKRIFDIWDMQRRREYVVNQRKKPESKDKNLIIRAALDQVQIKIEKQKLGMSTDLYVEIYNKDDDLRKLAESAISEWPE